MALAGPAAAQEGFCYDAERLVTQLVNRYGEAPVAVGMGGDAGNFPVNLWINDEANTFTVTVTRPDGTMCMIASGMDWRELAQPPNI